MPPLRYMGTPPMWDLQTEFPNDIVPQSYINYLLAQNMAQSAVTAQINAGLTSFATQSYATSAMASLATPAYVTAQESNYVPFSALGQVNGPAGLSATTGLLPVQYINLTSTQEWPQPFWSPTAYNTGTVTATTTPVQMYTISVPSPGFNYVLFCTGLADTQTATASGAYPVVSVHQGSPTGPIVAQGYGLAESYSGPGPGQAASEMILTPGITLTGAYVTLPNWTPVNNAAFTTTMVGPYMEALETASNVTIAGEIVFAGSAASGSKGGSVSTAIQIVTSTGTVVATGATVTGDGTATVSWTGNVTIGTQYGLQAGETGAATYATISSGSFSITPQGITNSGTASILPVPYGNQTIIAGATTLYVMLSSSDSTTQVTASTLDPGLWVMPIPWAAPALPSVVTADSASNGASAAATSVSWTHNLGLLANCLLVSVGAYYTSVGVSGWTRTVTAGGVAMTSLGAQNNDNTTGYGWSELFYLMNPPIGSVTIKVTETNSTDTPYLTGCSVAYQAVGSVGTASFAYGSSTSIATSSVTVPTNGMAVGFLCSGTDRAITIGASPILETAVQPAAATTNYCTTMLAQRATTGTITGTANSSTRWSAIGVALTYI